MTDADFKQWLQALPRTREGLQMALHGLGIWMSRPIDPSNRDRAARGVITGEGGSR
jgi:hypothetical protein